MLCQQIPGPGERHGIGVKGRRKQRHRLIPNLRVGHPCPVPLVIDSQQQHGEQISLVFTRPTPLGDDTANEAIKNLHGPTLAPLVRQRQPVGQRKDRVNLLNERVGQNAGRTD